MEEGEVMNGRGGVVRVGCGGCVDEFGEFVRRRVGGMLLMRRY